MALIFYGIDNEFAVATGDNVGTTANSSTFDNPPNGSKDLVITVQDGDDDPRLFEIGDTYDVSWGGQGGGGTILNAVVVRSDEAPGGGGIIVLEGVDENGDPAQVIWTPGFDLEGWYSDNYNPSNEPQFWTEDGNASYTHTYVCFAAGTLIDTVRGPVAVETLGLNDRVLTLDNGPEPVIWVGQRDCMGFRADAPVTFPTEAIGNTAPLTVSLQHRMLIRSARLALDHGHNEMLAPAKAFIGFEGVHRAPQPTLTYVHVLLREHHVIRANGALCESLFVGDATAALLDAVPSFAKAMRSMQMLDTIPDTARPVLRTRDAVQFLKMHGADIGFDTALSASGQAAYG